MEDSEDHNECIEIFESEMYQTPPSDWTARKGHQVMVCEPALSFEFESDETPHPEDFVFEGENFSYKGANLELVNGDDVYRMVWK